MFQNSVANTHGCIFLLQPRVLVTCDKPGKIVSVTKMFRNLFGNIFALREVIFCFRNNVS